MASQTGAPQTGQSDVTDEWLDDHLPGLFITFHPEMAVQTRETAAAIIAEAGVRAGNRVLDISSGAGVPAFELARIVGPEGHVTATDPSPAFIAALTDRSRELGLTNLDVVRTSAAKLPFPSASFDAATCHFGVMFFPDVQAGLTQIRHVLRPGGRAAFVAWGPREQNRLFAPAFGALMPHLPPPPPPPGPISSFPNPMRFSEPGSLSGQLRAAGFNDVREETRMVDLTWPAGAGRIAELWTAMFRVHEQAPPDRWADIDRDLRAAYAPYADGGVLRLSGPVVIASGMA